MLCGCSKSADGIFDYQSAAGDYDASITYYGESFDIKLSMTEAADGTREKISIEYLTPENIAGYTVLREGEQYYTRVGDIDIPVLSDSVPQLLLCDQLFLMNSNDITSVETNDSGNTLVSAEADEMKIDFIFSPEGKIVSAAVPEAEFEITFKATE